MDDMLRVNLCHVDICHALERTEKGIGVDLAHQRAVLGKQQIDAAVIEPDRPGDPFAQLHSTLVKRRGFAPPAKFRIGAEIAL